MPEISRRGTSGVIQQNVGSLTPPATMKHILTKENKKW